MTSPAIQAADKAQKASRNVSEVSSFFWNVSPIAASNVRFELCIAAMCNVCNLDHSFSVSVLLDQREFESIWLLEWSQSCNFSGKIFGTRSF